MSCSLIPPCEFDACVKQLREFFQKRGFIEVHTQNALSILYVHVRTQKPYHRTITVVKFGLFLKRVKWLEHVLLQNPDYKGFFA